MKPVAICRHSPTEGPGYFATFLDRHGIPWQVCKIDAGEPVPGSAAGYSGLVFMGGPMSVNDNLPWIEPVLGLIRDAMGRGVPVLGHCLGGQLMAKALGGTVSRNPVKEIGWGEVSATADPASREWLGGITTFLSFHWHGETFSIPDGAARILENPQCPNQAFVFGPHLGMQCHVEMTEDMVRQWARDGAGEIARNPVPSVQSAPQMEEDLAARVASLNRVADALYTRWIAGLAK